MLATGGMLLIHGAWEGSWIWAPWLPELERRGWRTHAIDLPGNGAPGSPDAHAHASMQTYLAALEAVIARAPGPMVIVAHSGGGVPASQIAQLMPEKVACLVYIAGMMLPPGISYPELVRENLKSIPGSGGILPQLDWSDDLSITKVRPAAALNLFVHDCAPEVARRATVQFRPQQESGRGLTAELTSDRFGLVPRIYIETLRDRAVLLQLQRKMQALVPGATIKSIDCGHMPQLARPTELADIVCATLADLGIEPDASAHAATNP